jgi:hypothetical protein
MRLRCEHEIPLSARYEAAVAQAVGLRQSRELERREEPKDVYRRLQVEADLPETVAALLGRIGVEGSLGLSRSNGAAARAARCAGG